MARKVDSSQRRAPVKELARMLGAWSIPYVKGVQKCTIPYNFYANRDVSKPVWLPGVMAGRMCRLKLPPPDEQNNS